MADEFSPDNDKELNEKPAAFTRLLPVEPVYEEVDGVKKLDGVEVSSKSPYLAALSPAPDPALHESASEFDIFNPTGTRQWNLTNQAELSGSTVIGSVIRENERREKEEERSKDDLVHDAALDAYNRMIQDILDQIAANEQKIQNLRAESDALTTDTNALLERQVQLTSLHSALQGDIVQLQEQDAVLAIEIAEAEIVQAEATANTNAAIAYMGDYVTRHEFMREHGRSAVLDGNNILTYNDNGTDHYVYYDSQTQRVYYLEKDETGNIIKNENGHPSRVYLDKDDPALPDIWQRAFNPEKPMVFRNEAADETTPPSLRDRSQNIPDEYDSNGTWGMTFGSGNLQTQTIRQRLEESLEVRENVITDMKQQAEENATQLSRLQQELKNIESEMALHSAAIESNTQRQEEIQKEIVELEKKNELLKQDLERMQDPEYKKMLEGFYKNDGKIDEAERAQLMQGLSEDGIARLNNITGSGLDTVSMPGSIEKDVQNTMVADAGTISTRTSVASENDPAQMGPDVGSAFAAAIGTEFKPGDPSNALNAENRPAANNSVNNLALGQNG